MKPSTWILAFLFTIVVVLPIGGCLALICLGGPPDVTVHATVIPRNYEHYSSAVMADYPAHNAYCYNLNTYIAIPNLDTSEINVANELGEVPVFRYADAVFIVLHKGRNYSRGLALADDASKTANEHRTIEFQELENGLYYWEQDGQREIREPDLLDRDIVRPLPAR